MQTNTASCASWNALRGNRQSSVGIPRLTSLPYVYSLSLWWNPLICRSSIPLHAIVTDLYSAHGSWLWKFWLASFEESEFALLVRLLRSVDSLKWRLSSKTIDNTFCFNTINFDSKTNMKSLRSCFQIQKAFIVMIPQLWQIDLVL